jgi:hypothetical protein
LLSLCQLHCCGKSQHAKQTDCDDPGSLEKGARNDRVSLSKNGFMSVDKVSRSVVQVVLAHYRPKVRNDGLLS